MTVGCRKYFSCLAFALFLSILIPAQAWSQAPSIPEILRADSDYPGKQTVFLKQPLTVGVAETWRQKLDPLCRMLVTPSQNLAKQDVRIGVIFRQLSSPVSLFQDQHGEFKVDVFVKLNGAQDASELSRYAVERRTQVRNIVVARVPVDTLSALAQADFVQFIQLSGQSHRFNDSGRSDIGAEQVHAGTGLPQGYQGEGVIVGVLDSGIDFTHPDFSNENGTRIHYLLEYTSGGGQIEWTKAQIDASPGSVTQRDGNGGGGHGTHVSGTAAGGGRLNPAMRGIAPAADIIFVKGVRNAQSGGAIANTDVVAGCQYIFQKAASMNRPAVINLSFGGHLGPHDGTNLFEQSLSALSRPGNIIVAAAGNDGLVPIHAGGRNTPNVMNETLLLINPAAGIAFIDMWYEREVLSTFALGAYSVDESGTLRFLGATREVRTGEFLGVTPLIVDNETIGYVAIDAQTRADPNNGDSRTVFLISDNDEPSIDIANVVWTLMSKGSNSGRMDMWLVTGGRFYDRVAGFAGINEMPGNTDYTVAVPSTANKVLAVGAYVTKNTWMSADGNQYNKLDPNPDDRNNPLVPPLGQLAFFSSRGPTRDGRISPDIAAPGEFIFSCLSSHLTAGIGYQTATVLQGGGYQGFQGTSMAAPHVTGTVALMLQANPGLTYELVSQFLQETGRSDDFTGSVPGNTFGAGRIDALAAVQKSVQSRTNSPPVLLDTSPASVKSGTGVMVTAEVTDDSGINAVHLSYRQGGDRTFTTIPMTAGVSYQGTIPGEFVTTNGVEYIIEATDLDGSVTRSPFSGVRSIRVDIGGEGEQKSTAQPADTLQTGYRLISMPLDLKRKDPEAVLADDLGKQHIKSWRLFELRNGAWVEYPNTVDFTPGKAFFLIVSQPGIKIDSGSGLSNDSGEAYRIPVSPGWNLIGNPFSFPVSTSKISFQKSNATPALRTFNGQWSAVGDVTEILPFEGYAVFSQLPTPDFLLVDPNSPSATAVAKPINKMDAFQWSIRIFAQCQQARDSDNVVAAIGDASPGWDLYDQPEPPAIGDFVSVYFPHPEWDRLTDFYSIDARPQPSEGDIWDFDVRTNIDDEVRLTFGGIGEVPGEFEIWLTDEALKLSQDLKKSNRVSLVSPPREQPKRLQLMIGKSEFIRQKIEAFQGIPEVFELSQNFPNPFNPLTTIRYALPQSEEVTLKVFNVLGKEVATLVDAERKGQGYHTAIWKAIDDRGLPVASGVYIFRIQAGSFSTAKKMILVK